MNDNIIKDWEFLMEGLPKSKTKRHKFARIYEKIIQHNDQKNIKMLLSIAYRIFNKIGDIKMSNGHKNSIEIGEFYTDDFYINNVIMIDQFMAFCDTMAEIIIEKLETVEKFSHLEINNNGQIKKINLIF